MALQRTSGCPLDVWDNFNQVTRLLEPFRNQFGDFQKIGHLAAGAMFNPPVMGSSILAHTSFGPFLESIKEFSNIFGHGAAGAMFNSPVMGSSILVQTSFGTFQESI